jgi:hypothetical protein
LVLLFCVSRYGALEACAHPFFDELRQPGTVLPNGRPLPPLFNFSPEELALAHEKGLLDALVPRHTINQLPPNCVAPGSNMGVPNGSNSNDANASASGMDVSQPPRGL